jgi:eukaryotic-like serine/threonine-protein kinase
MNNYTASKVKLVSCCRIMLTAIILLTLGLTMVGTLSVAAGPVSNSSQVGGQELEEEQQQQQQLQQGEWSLYQNATYGVSMLYPSNWTQQNSTGDPDDRFIYVSEFISPEETDGQFVIVTIAIDSMPQTTSVQGYRGHSIDIYRQDPNFQEFQLHSSSIGNFTLAGMPAYSFEIIYTDLEFGPQRMLEVGGIFDNRAYYIQYFADTPIYQKYLPIVERMIESFQIMQ